ncbi:hypothetical protein QOZ98_002329 [Planomicrobium stackebrandtii]|uniref:Uncharacterized protein n=1 Tax=Planomicrobium stackebrandtii TaxID=253160 RepID=A0ABU0GXK0_9BACL|nr:hypothetical protein [Planomicrobium stackebrandtii]
MLLRGESFFVFLVYENSEFVSDAEKRDTKLVWSKYTIVIEGGFSCRFIRTRQNYQMGKK